MFWEKVFKKLMIYLVLPEVMIKKVKNSLVMGKTASDDEQVYCSQCKGTLQGSHMIGCDNLLCKVQMQCVNIKRIPKGL